MDGDKLVKVVFCCGLYRVVFARYSFRISNMQNPHNNINCALFAHMLLLNCNLHFCTLLFIQFSKWYAHFFATTTIKRL